MIAIAPNKAIQNDRLLNASGNIGQEMRSMPYVPIFRSTPARMTDTAVGAST